MNATEALARLLEDPSAIPDGDLLCALRTEYPYLTLPAALALKRGAAEMSDSRRKELMAEVSLNVTSRDTLFRLLDPDGSKFDQLIKSKEPATGTKPTTDKAIDTFLETYGRLDAREEALLERMIFNPVPDYASVLEREEKHPIQAENDQDRKLDVFLQGEIPANRSTGDEPTPPAPVKEQQRHEPSDVEKRQPAREHKHETMGSLSESLAQIYIRQRKFDKAYDIIHSLSLNNPEKSVYFADQLRFLQKLMLNNRYRKQ